MRHGGAAHAGMRLGAAVEPRCKAPSAVAVPTAGRQPLPESGWAGGTSGAVRREDAVFGDAGLGPLRNRSCRTSSVLAAPTAGWQSLPGSGWAGGAPDGDASWRRQRHGDAAVGRG
jgi:hypothetical protein